jgi:hypothetical protein
MEEDVNEEAHQFACIWQVEASALTGPRSTTTLLDHKYGFLKLEIQRSRTSNFLVANELEQYDERIYM